MIGIRLVDVKTHEVPDRQHVAKRDDHCDSRQHELCARATDAVCDPQSGRLLTGDTADDRAKDEWPGRRADVGVGDPARVTTGRPRERVLERVRAAGYPFVELDDLRLQAV